MDILKKIRLISQTYSKKQQWEKATEEIGELLQELESGSNPFRYEELVYLPDNAWSEVADVFIMLIQLIMQHGAGDKVWKQVQYKVDRQLSRMHQDRLISDEEYRSAIGAVQPVWKDAVMRTFLGDIG